MALPNTKWPWRKLRLRVYYIGAFEAGLKGSLSLCDSRGKGATFPIAELSPTIEMLKTAWGQSPQLMIYVAVSDITAQELSAESADERLLHFKDIRATIGRALGGFLSAPEIKVS